jgi:hypothetical protein
MLLAGLLDFLFTLLTIMTSVSLYQTTLRHIVEDSILHENLKSRKWLEVHYWYLAGPEVFPFSSEDSARIVI